MLNIDLLELVRAGISRFPLEEAAEKFGVPPGRIKYWRKGGAPSIEAAQIALNEYFQFEHEAKIWEGKNVMFLLPVYHSISPSCFLSLFRNFARYGTEKIGLIMRERTLIVDARNYLVEQFLNTGAEWAIFIDNDVVLPMGDPQLFRKYGAKLPEPYQSQYFIDRIMASDKPLVGGLYFGRHHAGRGQYAECFTTPQENRRVHMMISPGVRPTQWVATGAMRIHRSVFEGIKKIAPKEFPEIIPKSPQIPWGFFNQVTAGIGEDVAFCLRAAKAGFQPHVDTGCVCMHVGEEFFGPTNTMEA